MSNDTEGDSRMLSSPEASDHDTPASQQLPDPATLSPPPSQPRGMPISASGSSVANSNGKRPLNTISNGAEDAEEIANMANNSASTSKLRADFPTRTHQQSGYAWSRAEDEPGYSWLNQKAVDEASRAWEALVHKDAMVKNRYGDIFAMVEKEKAAGTVR